MIWVSLRHIESNSSRLCNHPYPTCRQKGVPLLSFWFFRTVFQVPDDFLATHPISLENAAIFKISVTKGITLPQFAQNRLSPGSKILKLTTLKT